MFKGLLSRFKIRLVIPSLFLFWACLMFFSTFFLHFLCSFLLQASVHSRKKFIHVSVPRRRKKKPVNVYVIVNFQNKSSHLCRQKIIGKSLHMVPLRFEGDFPSKYKPGLFLLSLLKIKRIARRQSERTARRIVWNESYFTKWTHIYFCSIPIFVKWALNECKTL